MRRPRPRLAVTATVLAAVATVAAGAARAETGPDDGPGKGWSLSLGFSYVSTAGNTSTTSAGVDASFTREWPVWSLAVSGNAVTASENGVTTADRSALSLRTARDLGSSLGLTAGWSGERDRFAGLDLRSVVSAGGEWRARRTGPWTLVATAAMTWTRVDARGGLPTEDYLGGLVGATSRIRLSPTASTSQELNYYSKVDDASGWRVEAAARLVAAVSSRLAVKLGWQYRYDNEPVPGFGRTDVVTRVSLVVRLGDVDAEAR